MNEIVCEKHGKDLNAWGCTRCYESLVAERNGLKSGLAFQREQMLCASNKQKKLVEAVLRSIRDLSDTLGLPDHGSRRGVR